MAGTLYGWFFHVVASLMMAAHSWDYLRRERPHSRSGANLVASLTVPLVVMFVAFVMANAVDFFLRAFS